MASHGHLWVSFFPVGSPLGLLGSPWVPLAPSINHFFNTFFVFPSILKTARFTTQNGLPRTSLCFFLVSSVRHVPFCRVNPAFFKMHEFGYVFRFSLYFENGTICYTEWPVTDIVCSAYLLYVHHTYLTLSILTPLFGIIFSSCAIPW